MFGETTIFYVMIWNHPVETAIKKLVVWSSRWMKFTKVYHGQCETTPNRLERPLLRNLLRKMTIHSIPLFMIVHHKGHQAGIDILVGG